MTTEEAETRALIERYAAAWSRNDLEAAVACYHEDFRLHYFGRHHLAGEHIGKAAALGTLAEFSRRSRRRLLEVVATLSGRGRAAILAREALGPGAVEVERVLIYTVRDGLLSECWVYDQDQRWIDEMVDAG